LAAQQQLPLLQWQHGTTVTFTSACQAYNLDTKSSEVDDLIRAISAYMAFRPTMTIKLPLH